MSTITFDTHKFVRKLRDAGFDERQAEAVAEAFSEAHVDANPVTRDYLDVKLDHVSAKLRAEIEAAKADIIKWVAGLLLAQAALVAALVKLL
ncbi:DUF1640 domain-containing protein [Aromatoleum anaerobium]|uniref:DUF1640 domain-containing protein n=1 Tax=Aromatoleum anaerobium TaxID=182180 RepID=A0ABX1PR19_9RHOO|nr:DUF1640 domain-containing protein [Aromatoleum anaerobium]MCK0507948.1 DUF1640 domain-containing protein [Aromatoleum anaerobium]